MNKCLTFTKDEFIGALITYFRRAKEDTENYMDSNNLEENDYVRAATEFVDCISEFVLAQRQG